MNNVTLNSWQGAVQEALTGVTQGTLYFLPNLLGAILVLIIGILVGNWSKTLIVKTLQALKLESLVKETKFKKFLSKADVTQKIEELIGSIVKWLLMLTFFIAALNILGLTAISALLTSILGYVPNVISAVIVLAIGVLLAGLLESVVKGALASIDIKTSRLMGKVTSYIIITITILVAVSELNIAQSFINIFFIGFVTMLAIGFGLAIGLGSKDLVAKILSEWHTNLKKELKKK